MRLSYDASNYQAFTVDSTGAMTIAQDGGAATLALTNGNVGIGTTAPEYKFDVNGISAANYFVDNNNPAYGIDPAGTTNFGGYSLKISGGALLAFDSGNVGIGTTGPTGKLDITDTSNTVASLFLKNNTATTIGNGANTLGVLDLQSTSLTTGNFFNLETNALTTGKAANLTSTSNTYSTGSLFNTALTQTAAAGTAVSGNIASISFNPTYSTAITTPAITGNVLNISRSSTTNADFASTLTLSGALASFSDTATQTQGTLTSSADVVKIAQNYSANSGSALNITTSGGTGAFALRVNDNGTFTDSTPSSLIL